MTQYVKDGGIWKPAMPQVKDAGVWKPIKSGHVRDAGVWKQFHAGLPEYIGQNHGTGPTPSAVSGQQAGDLIITMAGRFDGETTDYPTGCTLLHTWAWGGVYGGRCVKFTANSTAHTLGQFLYCDYWASICFRNADTGWDNFGSGSSVSFSWAGETYVYTPLGVVIAEEQVDVSTCSDTTNFASPSPWNTDRHTFFTWLNDGSPDYQPVDQDNTSYSVSYSTLAAGKTMYGSIELEPA